jgi:anti-sigma regulatory factor (Ser/Thr protein kinase)
MRRMQAMTCSPTSGGADAVSGSRPRTRDPELGSGVGPASKPERDRGDQPSWPFSSYLELGALPSAVPCARLHARQVAWEWGLLDDLAATVELLVSELVTNGQRASARITGSRYEGRWTAGAPPVRLWLNADEERVLIQVWDGDPQLPEPAGIDLDAESGRGLLLVETLSSEWGAFPLEGSTGKVVWAVVSRGEGL